MGQMPRITFLVTIFKVLTTVTLLQKLPVGILHGHANISIKTAIQRYKQIKMIIKDQSVKYVFSSHQKVINVVTVPTGTGKPVSQRFMFIGKKPGHNFLQCQRT